MKRVGILGNDFPRERYRRGLEDDAYSSTLEEKKWPKRNWKNTVSNKFHEFKSKLTKRRFLKTNSQKRRLALIGAIFCLAFFLFRKFYLNESSVYISSGQGTRVGSLVNPGLKNALKKAHDQHKEEILNNAGGPIRKIGDTQEEQNVEEERIEFETYEEYIKYIQDKVPIVDTKLELAGTDVTALVDQQPFDRMAISKDTSILYDDFLCTGYQSNRKLPNEDILTKCTRSGLGDVIFVSSSKKHLSENTHEVKEMLLEDKVLGPIIKDIELDDPNSPVEKKQVFQYGAVTQWLEEHQCFIVYTRVLITKSGVREVGGLSVLNAQVYDKQWNEIKEKRIPYIDANPPKDLDSKLAEIDKKYGLDKKCTGEPDSEEYKECTQLKKESEAKAKKERRELTAPYYITYPTIIKVPTYLEKDIHQGGPEDPKMILRPTEEGPLEPVIIYNIRYDDNYMNRNMEVVFPHRKGSPVITLETDQKLSSFQKNWVPFLKNDDKGSVSSRGTIHIIIKMSPLLIAKCDLDSGKCVTEFDHKKEIPENRYEYSEFRGGTQFVKLPPMVPQLKGRNLWVGIMKTHIKDCGISKDFYRPHLAVLEEQDGKYYFNLISSTLHFHTSVLSWDLKSHLATMKNILSPGSIASWDILSQNKYSKAYTDVMQITFSEADAISNVVSVKGILAFIMNNYKKPGTNDAMVWNTQQDLDQRAGLGAQCALMHMKDYCDFYGEING